MNQGLLVGSILALDYPEYSRVIVLNYIDLKRRLEIQAPS